MMQLSIDFSKATPRMPREGTDNWKVLQMLLCGPCTNIDFCDARLANFRSRTSDLRKMGWNIPRRGERICEGVVKYRLERL